MQLLCLGTPSVCLAAVGNPYFVATLLQSLPLKSHCPSPICLSSVSLIRTLVIGFRVHLGNPG